MSFPDFVHSFFQRAPTMYSLLQIALCDYVAEMYFYISTNIIMVILQSMVRVLSDCFELVIQEFVRPLVRLSILYPNNFYDIKAFRLYALPTFNQYTFCSTTIFLSPRHL